ncbi:hypothetical protein MMYC01_200384 [Madurella mycetomatis]|uniref:Uncharacterized protein n=1 Tax=Madurella mycetomatis TaxID=100816 RepID=A0A175WHN0_9PEZI|nr:hypothetical protein MMYC01_200384 [Madurella mycetomatis]
MCEHIRLALERRLSREPGLVVPSPSQIRQISRNAAGSLQFSSTLAARPVTFVSWGLVKWFLRPEWDGDMVNDAWNLVQCKLWHALRGQYNLLDAVQGRSLANFMRAHMTLLNALLRERERPKRERHTCERRDRAGGSACFPDVLRAHPYGRDVAEQTRHAVASALDCLDRSVAEIIWQALVEDRARRKRGLGPQPCQEGEEISVVASGADACLQGAPVGARARRAVQRCWRRCARARSRTGAALPRGTPSTPTTPPVAMGVHLTCEGLPPLRLMASGGQLDPESAEPHGKPAHGDLTSRT